MEGTWLVCAQHPTDRGCWVILSAKNWPDLAGTRALWCYQCERPVALEREGGDASPDYAEVRRHLRMALIEMGGAADDGAKEVTHA